MGASTQLSGVSAQTMVDGLPDLLKIVLGDPKVEASVTSSLKPIKPNSTIFVSNEKYWSPDLLNKANILVLSDSLLSELKLDAKDVSGRCVLSSPNVKLAMALIGAKFFPVANLGATVNHDGIHPTAIIASTAKIGENVKVGPYTVIGENVNVAKNTIIGANSTIEASSSIGSHCHIHSNVHIAHEVTIGDRCVIQPQSTVGCEGFGYAHDSKGGYHRLPHYGRLVIENDVHLGTNVSVDRGTFDQATIGAHTIIDNNSHIGHNNTVGRGCIMTAGFISAGSATIGNYCIFGGGAAVGGHLTMPDHCLVTAMTGVEKAPPKSGKYAGFPVMPFREFVSSRANVKKLPKLIKLVKRIAEKLDLDGDL